MIDGTNRLKCALAAPTIKATGKAAGTLIYDETIAKDLFKLGFDFIAVGSDAATLARGADRIAAGYRSA